MAAMFREMKNEELVEKLERLGWTQIDLAKATGVTPQTVNSWHQGKSRVPNTVAAYVRHRLAVQRVIDNLGAVDALY
jgi:transcriptional regulator with XRE-family HTH domain